jgi:hypothetical protein
MVTRQPSSCQLTRLSSAVLEPNSTTPQEQVEQPHVTEVTIYPSPSDMEATIALPNVVKNDRDVWLFDMFGKAYGTATIEKGKWKTAVSTKDLPQGMYIIEVNDGDRISTSKVIVVHK